MDEGDNSTRSRVSRSIGGAVVAGLVASALLVVPARADPNNHHTTKLTRAVMVEGVPGCDEGETGEDVEQVGAVLGEPGGEARADGGAGQSGGQQRPDADGCDARRRGATA
jgi:hypothetical protein